MEILIMWLFIFKVFGKKSKKQVYKLFKVHSFTLVAKILDIKVFHNTATYEHLS